MYNYNLSQVNREYIKTSVPAVVFGIMDGKNKRGRPKRRRMDNVVVDPQAKL